MDAFQEAVAVPTELTDEAWEHLKPKLLTQRRQAEIKRGEFVDSGAERSGSLSARARPKTLQNRLEELADEIINRSWSDGRSINLHNSPRFASEVIDYVRKEIKQDTNFQHTKICVDHMKALFVSKIEPLVQTKELFRCGFCNAKKLFMFEGLINHCAAKHPSRWSVSQSSSAWQHVEWPLDPPFWIHGNRSHRPEGRPAHTPQHQNHQHTFVPPSPALYGASSMNLQQVASPAFMGSSGYPPPVYSGHAPSGHGHYSGAFSPFISGHTPYATPHPPSMGPWHSPAAFSSPQIPSGIPDFHKSQLDEVANISCEVWDALSKVRNVKSSVLVYVIIHHVVSRFQNRFSNEPNLDLFTECLVNHPMMRRLKDVQNLACKTCVSNNESHEEAHSQAFSLMSGARKFYSFPSLLTHFKNVHVEGSITAGDTRVDWKEDMIELESGPQDIADLATESGMDGTNLALLVEVFPNLFQRALRVDSGPSHSYVPGSSRASERGPPIVKREFDDQPYYVLGPHSDSGWSLSDQASHSRSRRGLTDLVLS
ncbi:MAG: hypothetical protein M1831_000675 [Alyxoria varia]|nr:MAG: hypothetical protein M1831_000675 [Alyxoria varia]